MTGRNYPKPRPGQPISAKVADRMRLDTERLTRSGVGSGLVMRDVAGISHIDAGAELTSYAQAPDGIPSLSGTAPGQATVTLYSFDGTNLIEGAEATAYNVSTGAVSSGKWLVLLRVAGRWVVVLESC